MLTIRFCIRKLGKSAEGRTKLKELFKLCHFTEREKWLIRYALIEQNMVENTCEKLNMQTTKYYTTLREIIRQINSLKYTNPDKFIHTFFAEDE